MADYAYLTDVGRQRDHNEDSVAAVKLIDGLLCVVADGMGGHAAGEVASQIAVDGLKKAARVARLGEPLLPVLEAAADEAHAAILEASKGGREGMGCTLTAAAIRPGKIELLHIGDSRAYLLCDGVLNQLTVDDTLVGEMVREKVLTEQQARQHPARSVLTRALGVGAVADFQTSTHEAGDGALLLLCSDGLTTHVEDDAIRSLITEQRNLKAAAAALVQAANENGGSDNITVVLARCRRPR